MLIVEDNVDSAETLAELIEIWGHEAQIVHHGDAAITTAATYLPDVVLLDIGLPGISGYEVAAVLRQQPDLEETILIALTGYGQEDDRRKAMSAGFDLHLTKPVNPDQLHRVLAQTAPGGVALPTE